MPTDVATLVLTDPKEPPTYGDGPLSRWCQGALYEARDEVFVRLTIKVMIVMSVGMGVVFWGLRSPLVPMIAHWPIMLGYLSVWGWYSASVILMLHNTMHRPFIRRPKWLDYVHPYVMSFYFGIPVGYAVHHLGMHHVEDNLPTDLSSTMRYRRDSFLHFLVYFFRFFFLAIVELPIYLVRKRRTKMAKKALLGEAGHAAVIAGAMALDWRFGVVCFLVPFCSVRFLMMVGNWGQHAFLNPGRQNDGLSNAVTSINCGYNHRAFNDGYHIGHHLKASRHWSEMPQDFLDNREKYAREGAMVFEKIDNFLISILLWTGQWKILARCFIRLDGQPKSDEEVIAMLKSRVLPIQDWPETSPSAKV